MSFTYNISTELGKLRMAIGDSDADTGKGAKPDGTNFEDEELEVFLNAAGSWTNAVAPVLRMLAGHYARKANVTWVEAYKEDLTKTAAELRASADDWEQNARRAMGGTQGLTGYKEDAPFLFGTSQWGASPTDQGS